MRCSYHCVLGGPLSCWFSVIILRLQDVFELSGGRGLYSKGLRATAWQRIVDVVLPRKKERISGPIIKEKEIGLHKKREAGSEFAASEGWIDHWKIGHGVRFVSTSGEKLSSGAEAAKRCSVKFQELVEE